MPRFQGRKSSWPFPFGVNLAARCLITKSRMSSPDCAMLFSPETIAPVSTSMIVASRSGSKCRVDDGRKWSTIQGPSAILPRTVQLSLNLYRWHSTGSATTETLLYCVGQIKRMAISHTPNITRTDSRLRSGRRKKSRFGNRTGSETDGSRPIYFLFQSHVA